MGIYMNFLNFYKITVTDSRLPNFREITDFR